MGMPYGLEVTSSCLSCKFRRDHFFCQLSPAELKDFDMIKSIVVYPADSLLFVEKQKPRGFFQICQGEVKLSLTSTEGKTLVLRLAKAGDFIGMEAVLSGVPYEATAETLRPCQIAFVSTDDFRKYLCKHPSVFMRVAKFLGPHYVSACEQLSDIGLTASVLDRTVTFLLKWPAESGVTSNESRFALHMTHEQIAEHLGVSRESVTRTLSVLRKKGLIEIDRSTFTIPDRAALRSAPLHESRPNGVRPHLVRPSRPNLQRQPRADRQSKQDQYANMRKRA